MGAEPTQLDAITAGQQKLLNALEAARYDTITELCEAAGVSRQTYYDSVSDENFVKQIFRNTTGSIYASIPRIMDKVTEQAKRGSFAHQKLLFEMVKLYQGVPETNVQVNNFTVVRGE